MAPFIKLFGVCIDVSMKGDEAAIEVPLRLKPPCCVAVNNPNEKRNKKNRVINWTGPRGGGKRRRRAAEEVQEPDRSIPPQLLERVKSEPGFLYHRKLTTSDVREGQSRLFVLKKEGFQTMLTEGEWGIVNGEGLKKIVGVDTRGRLYKLGLKIWPSLDMLVINSQWSKLVKQNDAKEDDWVQIWGHRDHIGNLCMAINFIKAA